MTVNITINADTLELTNVDGMTRIVCNDTEKKDKPESECDWIVRRKLKPVKINGRQSLKEGLYFRRDIDGDQWIPYIFKFSNNLIYTDETELLGPITPDMFL
jgi:hypothetical protein